MIEKAMVSHQENLIVSLLLCFQDKMPPQQPLMVAHMGATPTTSTTISIVVNPNAANVIEPQKTASGGGALPEHFNLPLNRTASNF